MWVASSSSDFDFACGRQSSLPSGTRSRTRRVDLSSSPRSQNRSLAGSCLGGVDVEAAFLAVDVEVADLGVIYGGGRGGPGKVSPPAELFTPRMRTGEKEAAPCHNSTMLSAV